MVRVGVAVLVGVFGGVPVIVGVLLGSGAEVAVGVTVLRAGIGVLVGGIGKGTR